MVPGRRRLFHVAFAATACVMLWMVWNYEATVFPRSGPQWAPDSYKWRTVEQHYPLTSFRPLPTGKPRPFPPVQATFPAETAEARDTRLKRKEAIKDAFVRAWSTYKEHAWLHDEVTPISLKSSDGFGGWGATLVDSLDTLWIMGLRDEFDMAVDAVHNNITFETTSTTDSISVFETSIRFLGGLLAAYDLSGDFRLLSKARDVGDMLYKAFDTPSRLPIPRWDLHAAAQGEKQANPDKFLLAELGSHAMEFTRLSVLTRDPKYYETVARITDLLIETQMKTKVPGLWPTKVGNTADAMDSGDEYTFGAEADSTFEYMAKMPALLGGQVPEYETMYSRSIDAAAKHLFYRPLTPGNDDVLVSGTARANGRGEPRLETSAQHLSCFAGGMLALGGRLTGNDTHVELGRKLTYGCITLYKTVPIGIMPEACRITACPDPASCDWDTDHGVWHDAVVDMYGRSSPEKSPAEIIEARHLPPGFTDIYAKYYILRPEAIESVFVLYRVTADAALMDRAWDMWTAIDEATRTERANSAILDVTPRPGAAPSKSDSMESFWLSETLKYFYLLYSEPDLISLDEWVLNTEAHPFRRMVP
ncbi:Endoplasmic reticulum mannosyl-oligosaccharide 1,2-alpha-mannosidase [Madurella mycetomatis]|uniref:alpha-1,2-Mannosidase n=1 Tax=Madurella mycetomatis TaxID=100816 RepID=A0A175W4R6_9PEZI|nr:Endoplasmic reticulum mannosyl-oligosaccharide 1,2-alpha-mannosidase [Madurella mycetomatis]